MHDLESSLNACASFTLTIKITYTNDPMNNKLDSRIQIKLVTHALGSDICRLQTTNCKLTNFEKLCRSLS